MTPERWAFMDIFFIDVVFDLSKNEHKKYAEIKAKHIEGYNNSNEKNRQYFIKVLKKIMDCKYIEEKYKQNLRNIWKKYKLIT